MADIIQLDRSVIPACDVDVEHFERLVIETCAVPKIGAYKIGAALALSVGLPKLAEIARKHTLKPLIYDHQKACTDIPDTGLQFVTMVKNSGMDALIMFPLSGPATQEAWIGAALDINLAIIMGGYMTHERYLTSDDGYIDAGAVDTMFTVSASYKVNNYVVPGNKPQAIGHLRELLEKHGISPVLYAPGFIAQGGTLKEAAHVAGSRWHAIVGRALYDAKDIQKEAELYVSQL